MSRRYQNQGLISVPTQCVSSGVG
uniref:Uncharacterized protein n=1 Tax=Lepeophtheirus salmonis TaxID=72036 RepID=A0A0K2TYX3_LEPSM